MRSERCSARARAGLAGVPKLCALLALAGCSGFDQRAEFWPLIESVSNGGAGGAPMSTGAAGSAQGGAGQAGSTDATTTGGGTFGVGGAGGVEIVDASDDSMIGETGGAGGGALDAGSDGNAGSGGAMDAGSGSCTLSVTVTTVTANGNYSPRNIGAIWIARSTGTFVKSLNVWARQRIRYLTLWNSQTSAAGVSGNTVDAITGATLSSHQTHKVTWNCTDTSRNPVADGAYRVYFELTDRSGTGPNGFVSFTKGPMPFTMNPPDLNNFKNISMVYTP